MIDKKKERLADDDDLTDEQRFWRDLTRAAVAKDKHKIQRLTGGEPELRKLDRPSELQKTREAYADLRSQLADLAGVMRDTCDRLDRIEKADRQWSATQKFVKDAPVNGAQQSGLSGINVDQLLKYLKG